MPARENLIFMPAWTMPVLYLLFAAALAVMTYGLWARVAVYRTARKAVRIVPWRARFRALVRSVLAQEETTRKKFAGPMHAALFYGFLALFVGTVLVGIDYDLLEPFGRRLLSGSFYLVFELVLDLLGLAFVVGLVMAVFRRVVLRPTALVNRRGDAWALALLGVIAVTGFLLEGLRLHLAPVEWARFSPLGATIARTLEAVRMPASQPVRELYVGLWWFHAAASLALIAAIPFTKMIHLLTTTANVMTQTDRVAPGQLSKPFDLRELMARETLEEGAFHLDADRPGDLGWKHLLMADACTNCGRCEEVCPATAAGRPLSPRVLIQDVDHAAFFAAVVPPAFGRAASEGPGAAGPEAWARYAPNGPMLGAVIREETLWACVTCRACEEACPVAIEHVGLIVDMRRDLVMNGRIDPHQQQMLSNTERKRNPWGDVDRMAWTALAEGVRIRQLSELSAAELDALDLVYWVGCASASDPRAQRIAAALARILDAAHLSWAILGREELCTGDPARRLGDEARFQELALENVERLGRYPICRVVATCPHCFNTLKNEYRDFGFADAEVLHHTELIEELIATGRIELERGVLDRVAYHDACYLGRHNGVYEAPRRVLGAVPGLEILEVEGGCREHGRCCGAGGANMFFEVEERTRMNHLRLDELLSTGARSVASNCPFCTIMFEDAKLQLAPDTETYDVAEIVAASLAPAGSQSAHHQPRSDG